MQLILDHINSLIVSLSVILILSAVQIGSRRTSLEQTTSYSTKVKAISFGEWMEQDILSIGANFGSNPFRFVAPTNDAQGNTTQFTFYSDSVITYTTTQPPDTLRLMTRYQLVQTDSVMRGGDTMRLYQLLRYLAAVPVNNGQAPMPPDSSVVNGGVPGPNAWTPDGRSLGTLSGFRIGLLERTGLETTNVERADFLRIQFRLVPEFPIEPEYLRELYWTTTLKVRPFWEPPPDDL